MTGFLGAAGLIGRAATAAGHGFTNRHKRLGEVSRADVVLEAPAANGVFGLEHHCGLHFWRVADFARCRVERAHQLEDALTEPGCINADILDGILLRELADGFGLLGKVHPFPLMALENAEFATGDDRRRDDNTTGTVAP